MRHGSPFLPCFLYEYEPACLPESPLDSYVNRLIVRSQPATGATGTVAAEADE
jgi:hypothetical protein